MADQFVPPLSRHSSKSKPSGFSFDANEVNEERSSFNSGKYEAHFKSLSRGNSEADKKVKLSEKPDGLDEIAVQEVDDE
jgi:hypothetical protein